MRQVIRRDSENALRDRVCRDARRLCGVPSLQLNLGQNAGWPDRLFLTPWEPLFMEFKRRGDKPRPLQLQRLDTLVGLGYLSDIDAGWTDSYEEAMARIRRACAG